MIHDPDAALDYAWDWTDWLGEDTIASYEIIAPAGITVGDTGVSDGVVTAWISGGTAGTIYPVVCRITTTAGRTDDRTLPLVCDNR